MNWTLLLALGGFISAAAKYLDDYYVRTDTRNRIRDSLTAWFIALDSTSIPDFLERFLWLFRFPMILLPSSLAVLGAWFAWGASASLVSGLGPYIGSDEFGIFGEILDSLGTWMPRLNSLVVVVGLGLMLLAFHSASKHLHTTHRVPWILGALVFPAAASLTAFLLTRAVVFRGWGTDPGNEDRLFGFVVSASFVLNAPGILIAFLPSVALFIIAITLGTLRTVMQATRWLLLVSFDSASSPKTSPLTYFAATVSTIMAGIKATVELTSTWEISIPNPLEWHAALLNYLIEYLVPPIG